MLFSFRLLGPLTLTQSSEKELLPLEGEDERQAATKDDPLQELALRGPISISAEIRVPGAGSKCSETSADALRLVPIQFTSTLANQNSVLVIHTFAPFVNLGPLTGPSP